MLEFVIFLFTQLGNFIMWFDTIDILGSITLLKLLIIVILFAFILRFLGGKHND